MITSFSQFLQGLLPNYCLLCLNPTHSTLALCPDCLQDLPWNTTTTRCRLCARGLAQDNICGTCLRDPPAFTRVISPLHYHPPVDRFIQQLKFNQQLIYAHILGKILGQYLQQLGQPLPEAILPVPLHRQRLRQRGYNQAAEIGKHLARQLKIPCDQGYLIRCKNTKAQAQLKVRARQANVKNAFSSKVPIPYAHIAVLDDVMTSGATLRQLCLMIRQGGVSNIEVWCVARA